jgi:parallel beta-helix repeat protein
MSGVASAYLSTEYVGNTIVDLSWTQYESTDFSKYELYRDGRLIETIRDRTVTFYRDEGLTKGHTYNYEIRSYYTTDKYRSDTTSATTGEVHGTITRNTVWTAASSPYTLTERIWVRNGSTLRIESGVMVTTVLYTYGSSITVREKGALYADSVSFSGVSLSISDDSHAGIKNCSFEHAGIGLFSSNNTVITGNTLSNSSTFSITLSGSENNVITGNTVSNNEGGGIILSSSSNNTITDNNVSNNGHGIGLSSSSNNTITGNIATNNKYCGIDLENSSNNYITNNNVSNNDWFGIMFCGFCNNNTIKNNIANK